MARNLAETNTLPLVGRCGSRTKLGTDYHLADNLRILRYALPQHGNNEQNYVTVWGWSYRPCWRAAWYYSTLVSCSFFYPYFPYF